MSQLFDRSLLVTPQGSRRKSHSTAEKQTHEGLEGTEGRGGDFFGLLSSLEEELTNQLAQIVHIAALRKDLTLASQAPYV